MVSFFRGRSFQVETQKIEKSKKRKKKMHGKPKFETQVYRLEKEREPRFFSPPTPPNPHRRKGEKGVKRGGKGIGGGTEKQAEEK